MKWIKYTIETKNETADIVSSVLFDNGICGAEIDDTLNLSAEDLKEMYVDIPIVKKNTGIAKVSFYVAFDENVDKINLSDTVVSDTIDNSYIASKDNIFKKVDFEKIYNNIKYELDEYKGMMDMGTLNITTTELDDVIFLNKWKENFKRFDISDMSIIPSWEKNIADNQKFNIYIEPGSAFGTGQHSTTKLCAILIKEYYDGKNSFLDIGCGSGILAIIAKKLGVKNVKAIDIDKGVKDNLIENILLNFDNKDEIDIDFGNLLDDIVFYNKIKKDKYDIVVANILAPVIISLIKDANIYEFINENGYFICSGIIAEMESKVIDAINSVQCFTDIKVLHDGNWIAISARRTKDV